MFDKKIQKNIGMRIAYARERAGLTQMMLSEKLGFSDRQTLSSIEKGHRQISAEEIAKISKFVGRPVTWLLDPFWVFGKGNITWRIGGELSDKCFSEIEEQYGSLLGFACWLMNKRQPVEGGSPFSSTLEIDVDTPIEDVVILGETVANHLSLNIRVPAVWLPQRVSVLGHSSILYIDAKPDTGRFYDAVCKVGNLRIILVNRQEDASQRNYSIARGLFQALTWNNLTPPEKVHVSNSDFLSIERGTKSRAEKIEKMTHAFVAGLLISKATLSKSIHGQETIGEWQLLAKNLQVPVKILAFKLLHDKVIGNSIFTELINVEDLPGEEVVPSLYSSWFLNYLGDAINEGHVSVRKTMRMLNCTREDLLEIFRSSETKLYIGS